jgi:hypothetical protein
MCPSCKGLLLYQTLDVKVIELREGKKRDCKRCSLIIAALEVYKDKWEMHDPIKLRVLWFGDNSLEGRGMRQILLQILDPLASPKDILNLELHRCAGRSLVLVLAWPLPGS